MGSCSNNGIKTPQEIITTKDTIANVPTASLKQVDPYSTPAIGNLYLGVSLSEFEKQKTKNRSSEHTIVDVDEMNDEILNLKFDDLFPEMKEKKEKINLK